jgi:hypothetical protein
MINNPVTIILTLLIVTAGCYFGLKFVRKFALQIAMENHDAIKAMDEQEEEAAKKRERAEAAAETAYAKVQPLLTTEKAAAPASGNAASVSAAVV